MYILGIGDHLHDPSVCLMYKNEIVAAVELERLTRVKHNVSFNQKYYSIKARGAYFKGLLKRYAKYRHQVYNQGIDYCLGVADIKRKDVILTVSSSLYPEPYDPVDVTINHHLAHAASAFYSSPFQEAAILTLDGFGNEVGGQLETGLLAKGENKAITCLQSLKGEFSLTDEERHNGIENTIIVLTNSLGAFYKNITLLIGLGDFGEGKTMGLAAYGKMNAKLHPLYDHIACLPDGRFSLDNRAIYLFCERLLNEASMTMNHHQWFQLRADMAYLAQEILEKIIIHCCQALYEQTRVKALCLAGGVALNSTMNGKILEKTPFEQLFVQPAAGDSGIAIGCAQYGAHVIKSTERHGRHFSPYLGRSYESAITVKNDMTKHVKEVLLNRPAAEVAAAYLDKAWVIGWFQGRGEIGPRALGNRSILADPRHPMMKDYINKGVKCREAFRPFAPSVLEEEAAHYFYLTDSVPYMLTTCLAKESVRDIIPAVIHQDGTARVQTVSYEQNPRYYSLIQAFKKITGIPMVLNTSFNGNNEPIVETPEQALWSCCSLGLDAIFINDQCFVNLLSKNPLRDRLEALA